MYTVGPAKTSSKLAPSRNVQERFKEEGVLGCAPCY